MKRVSQSMAVLRNPQNLYREAHITLLGLSLILTVLL